MGKGEGGGEKGCLLCVAVCVAVYVAVCVAVGVPPTPSHISYLVAFFSFSFFPSVLQ